MMDIQGMCGYKCSSAQVLRFPEKREDKTAETAKIDGTASGGKERMEAHTR
jgi:hypothetical protein